MNHIGPFFSIVLLVLSMVSMRAASAWPQFLSPAGGGLADEFHPPVHFGPSSNLLWKAEAGKGHSSPILSGSLVFLTGSEGSHLETFCFELASGKLLWKQFIVVPALEKLHEANSAATPTPVCDQNRVYAYFGSFGLVCYDFEGHEVWRRPLPMPKTFMDQGTGSSPLLVGDAVIVFEQNSGESALMAFGAKDGKELWKTPCPVYNATWSTPMSWKEEGGERVGLACPGRFSAFDLGTGKLVWWAEGLSKQVCSTPIFSDGTLYISSASVQGERSNMRIPPPFEEFAKQYDKNGDGLISFDEIPADYLFTDRQASGGAGNMTLRQAMEFFAGLDTSKTLDKKAWDNMKGGLKGFMDSEWNNSNLMAVGVGGKDNVTESKRLWLETRGIP